MISPQTAQRLKESAEWKAVENHLLECRDIINSVDTIHSDFGEEARARKRAIEIIDLILEPFKFSFEENKNKKEELMKKYGIM